MSVHGDGKTPGETIADWVLSTHPKLAGVGESLLISHKGESIEIAKPGIVHRLDKETSGVMLLAKTQAAYEHFKAQFQGRDVKKVYNAFVYGWPKEDEIFIDAAIGRSTGDIRRYGTGKNVRGAIREAQTMVRVLKRFGGSGYQGRGSTEDGTYSFVEAEPKTGRTHQIRVHLLSINHSIVSDSLYSPKRKQALGFNRLALHARSLTVRLPGGEEKTVTAPYPEDFEKALAL
jgi:23S rRNA pseudouridine1911/1915/1917 synthase